MVGPWWRLEEAEERTVLDSRHGSLRGVDIEGDSLLGILMSMKFADFDKLDASNPINEGRGTTSKLSDMLDLMETAQQGQLPILKLHSAYEDQRRATGKESSMESSDDEDSKGADSSSPMPDASWDAPAASCVADTSDQDFIVVSRRRGRLTRPR